MKNDIQPRLSPRSGVSVAIALSILASVQLPAAAAVGQAMRAPSARPVSAPPALPSTALLPVALAATPLSASLAPALSAPALAPRAALLASPAVRLAVPADAPQPPSQPSGLPEAGAAPKRADGDAGPRWVAPAGTPSKQDGGPRWVAPAGTPSKQDGGPRWVAPKQSPAPAPSRLRAALAKWLPFVGRGEAFDGSTQRKDLVDGVSAETASGRPSRLLPHSHSHRHEVVQDLSIPTPDAVKRVAGDAGPRWVKYFAPVAIIAATVLVFQASIVPAAIVSGALMLSILAHESAHILGLRIWGDKTPALAGRDSINPLKHISLLGTVLVPAASLLVSMSAIGFPILFGWAKPVPVDFNNLKNPKTDAAKVAALGPLTNLALAAVAGLAFLAFPAAGVVSTALLTLFKMNLALTAFNLLPLPFLDGGKILVSMLPKSWYARWTHDPHLPMGYQRFYKAIYEGPANLLSKLHVHSFDHINGITRLASLAALGAFYAAFFTVLQVPLMFLALPCSYDYWCIREKVRSEAAVKDLMGIMSEWSAVIVQIAEDKGLDSEVSAYETEHAMKNALEDLIDKLMAEEAFKALSDDEKIEAMMRRYPDFAVSYLKDKAMPEDSEERIREVLADPRNGPYYDRLRGWLKDHDIFKRWDNKHEQGKLKESMKEADKKRASGGPGSAALGLAIGLLSLGAFSSLFPGAAPQMSAFLTGLGFLGMLGTLVPVAPDVPGRVAPIARGQGLAANQVRVRFASPLVEAEYDSFSTRNRSAAPAASTNENGSYLSAVLTYPSVTDAAEAAAYLAGRSLVSAVEVSPEALAAAEARTVATAPSWLGKVGSDPAVGENKVRFTVEVLNDGQVLQLVRGIGAELRVAGPTDSAYVVTTPGFEASAEVARVLAGRTDVTGVVVAPSVSERLSGRPAQAQLSLPAVADPALSAGQSAKLEAVHSNGPLDVLVIFDADAGDLDMERITGEIAPGRESDRVTAAHGQWIIARDEADAIAIARRAAVYAMVEIIKVAPSVHAALVPAPAAPAVPAPAAEAAPAAAADWLSRVSDTESPALGELQFYVEFMGEHDAGVITAAVETLAPGRPVEQDGAANWRKLTARDADDMAALIRAFAEAEQVNGVWINPAIRAALPAAAAAVAEAPVAPAPSEAPAAPTALTLPNKVSSHGKEEWSSTLIKATLNVPATPEWQERLLRDTGSRGVVVGENEIDFNGIDPDGSLGLAQRLAERSDVASVSIHPNAAARLVKEAAPYPDAQSYDHERSVLVEFAAGTTVEEAAAYGENRRLRLVYNGFRGREGMALFELTPGADIALTMDALAAERHPKVGAVRPLRERAGVEAPQLPAPAAPAVEETAGPVELPRRDPHQAWVEYLQNLTLNDGKSNLSDKQIQLLATFLRPVAKPKGEERAPVVARNAQVKEILPIVTSPRGMRNSVVIIGEAGVGKTAVAEGLAQLMEDLEAGGENAFLKMDRLKGRWLVELDINKMLTNDDPVGLLGAILELLPLMNKGDASRGNDIIVLMDEIQKFFLDPNGVKIANTLKGPLRDGKISVIATTTRKEYKEYIEGDDAFRRRFHKVEVEETNVEQTISILRALRSFFQRLHKAKIPDETLVASAKLSHQFDKTNYNPDKAIKLVQDSAELSRPENLRAAVALDLRETWNQLVVAANEARQLLIDKGIASTLALPIEAYNQIFGLIEKAEALMAEQEAIRDGEGDVTVDVAKRALAIRTGIASGQLNLGEEDAARYNTMEDEIEQRVVNQRRALTAIANAVRSNKAGLSNPTQPMGKFLFVGPTGVGKTYLAKELARFLFNDPEAMIRFDMSEFMEPHSVARLNGAPPGYVGYGAGGQLTEAVRKKPYSVILLDEVEKAHPDVFNMLLQILDDGRLTDGEGRTVDFKNVVIIMTSNIGMRDVDGEKFAARYSAATTAEERAAVEREWDAAIDGAVGFSAKQFFRPEFLNRLDEDPQSKQKWVRVNRLRPEDAELIAKLQVKEFERILEDRHGTVLKVDPSFIEFIRVEGFSPLYGARPMKAAVDKYLRDPLAEWILKESSEGRSDVRGGLIEVGYKRGKVTFKAKARPAKQTARATVKGASVTVAAQVLKLIEQLAGEGEGDEPSEQLFDGLMRGARAESAPEGGAPASAAAAERKQAFLSPGAAARFDGLWAVLEHNNSKKKDATLRTAIAAARESTAAWGSGVQDLLDAPAGSVGEGWLKQVGRYMKEHATKAGAAEPISVNAYYGEDAVRVAFRGSFRLSEDDEKSLLMHFSGAPPKDYLTAQQKADQLNMSARLLWDHNLLDLYRRLSAVPGARMGYATGAEGTQIWVEFRKPQAEAPAPAATASADAPKATPHQNRQMEKTRRMFMTIVDQDRLSSDEQDGHSLRIAAAEGWARLSVESDLEQARAWLRERKLADADTSDSLIKRHWPLVMTAALVLERFGGAEDIALLETVAKRFTSTGHYQVPLHNALSFALASLYTRSGLDGLRAAMSRSAQLKSGDSADIRNGLHRAFGAIGMPVDEEYAKRDSDGLVELYGRQGRLGELVADLYAVKKYDAAEDARKMAILKAAAETEVSDQAVGRLRETMSKHASYSRVGYEAARAIAAVVARSGRTGKIGDAIKRWLDKNDISDYSAGNKWTQLLAYVELARLAGKAEDLPGLESLLDIDPDGIGSIHEQAYFTSPDAWARTLVRAGKFEEYARPTLGADGAPGPSKLEAMLASKNRPMKAAAALSAIAYARDPFFKPTAWKVAGDVPDMSPLGSSTSSDYPGSPGTPRMRVDPLAEFKWERINSRFGRDGFPPR